MTCKDNTEKHELPNDFGEKKNTHKGGWSEMTSLRKDAFCFVIDANGKQLSPTKVNKGWYLIRKGRAVLKERFPMVIQLIKVVDDAEIDKSTIVIGIDDGAKQVGIGIVQNGKEEQKAVFKAVLNQRNDIRDRMDTRRCYRRYRRSHKRYRPPRFDHRGSSICKGRLAPTIKQKKEAIIRVVKRLSKWIRIDSIVLEDVKIDIRALTDGFKPYKWQYQESNRLDENLRIATLMRDKYTCQLCGANQCLVEAHHIAARRLKGAHTIWNLITLCHRCHSSILNREPEYAERFYALIRGKNIRLDFPQHVMQGKNFLRNELGMIAELSLTTGGDTANKRIDYDIEKTHENDALVIAGIKSSSLVHIESYIIRPMRRRSEAGIDELNGFKHRDLVKYTKINKEYYVGWITALYPKRNQCNITTTDGKILKRYGLTRISLMWRFDKLYFLSDYLNDPQE